MEFRNGMEFLVQLIFILFFSSVQAGDIAGLDFFRKNTDCRFEKDYQYLSEEKANELSMNRIIQKYRIQCGKVYYEGYLFNDKIRTHYQNIFAVLRGKEIVEVEVISFLEPQQYSAPEKWIEIMFKGKKIDQLKVDALSGATLTTQSYKRIFKNILELSK